MNQSAFGRAEARVSHDRKAENEIDVVVPHGERGSEVAPGNKPRGEETRPSFNPHSAPPVHPNVSP